MSWSSNVLEGHRDILGHALCRRAAEKIYARGSGTPCATQVPHIFGSLVRRAEIVRNVCSHSILQMWDVLQLGCWR